MKMYKLALLLVLAVSAIAVQAQDASEKVKYAIVIHGGAGRISSDPDHQRSRCPTLPHERLSQRPGLKIPLRLTTLKKSQTLEKHLP